MKNYVKHLLGGLAALTLTSALVFVTGCAGTPVAPKPTGFLSQYVHLKQVNDSTWRYVFTNRLALYNQFEITTVKVVPTQFEGKPISEEQKQKAAEFIRESITKALNAHGYAVVSSGGPNVGQIRVAITDIYKLKDQMGLTVEGEILDASSGYQAAAVMKSELGDVYLGSWWDGFSAKEIVNHWSARLAQAINMAHGK